MRLRHQLARYEERAHVDVKDLAARRPTIHLVDRRASTETGDPRLLSAAPPVWARAVAFLSIVMGGACGGLIGYAVVDLQCAGRCGVTKGLGTLVGAIVAATGVAIVTALVLRAMGEWRAIQQGIAQADSRTRRKPSA